MVDLNKTFEWKDSIDITVADLNTLCGLFESEIAWFDGLNEKKEWWEHLIACHFHCNIERIPRATKREIVDFVSNYYETIYKNL